MKKLLIFSSLIAVVLLAIPDISLAKKKYRYIKREHGVRFQGNLPAKIFPTLQIGTSIAGSYTYNMNGRLEIGPYFSTETLFYPQLDVSSYTGGLLVEYNIVKNRGKRKFIPTIGLKLGVENDGGRSLDYASGLYLATKLFIAKRTSFIITLEYLATIPRSFNFKNINHNVNLSGGFAYYFDFY